MHSGTVVTVRLWAEDHRRPTCPTGNSKVPLGEKSKE